MKETNPRVGRPDPLIDEVREIRRRIEEECGGDLERMAERANLAGEAFRLRMEREGRTAPRIPHEAA